MIISIANLNKSVFGKLKNTRFHFSLILCWVITIFSFDSLSAQEQEIKKDQPADSIYNEYIIDYKKRFNVKLEVSNDIATYDIVNDGLELALKPNLNLRYAVVFSYKFLSVRLGIRPKISDEQKEEKGGSDTFRLRFQLLFDNWNHVLQYSIDKGYYVSNTADFIDTDTKIRLQFPEMSSNVFFGASSYKFNKNYSMRAFQSQTEIQTKSAGSFMPGISYNFYSLTGTGIVKDLNGDRILRDVYSEYQGMNFALLAGYYYTFVLKKYWFINAYGVPSAGMDFYNADIYDPAGKTKRSFNDLFLALNYGFGGGYNGDKIFFGTEFKRRLTNEKFNSNKIRVTPTQNEFSVYFGYRFKAPKTISKPVDMIEDKVPILKDGTNEG
jgi:hypothetical protein